MFMNLLLYSTLNYIKNIAKYESTEGRGDGKKGRGEVKRKGERIIIL